MKVTIGKDALASVLRKVLSAVSTKTTIPVLNNILLEAQDGALTLAATDLEVYVKSSLDAGVERAGSTTLPAKKFAQIVAGLPDGEIRLVTNERQQTEITCGKAFYRIMGLDGQEFPREGALEGGWVFSIKGSDLRRTLNKVAYATSTDETRHVLNGVLISVRGGVMTAVGTDGRRLALVEKTLDGDVPGDCDAILPQKVIGELVKVLDSDAAVSVHLSESRAAFLVGRTLITSRLVEGSYPNYRQVVPASFTHSAVIPRETFSSAISRMAMVVTDVSGGVAVKLEKALMTVSASSTDVGEGNETFEVSYEGTPWTSPSIRSFSSNRCGRWRPIRLSCNSTTPSVPSPSPATMASST